MKIILLLILLGLCNAKIQNTYIKCDWQDEHVVDIVNKIYESNKNNNVTIYSVLPLYDSLGFGCVNGGCFLTWLDLKYVVIYEGNLITYSCKEESKKTNNSNIFTFNYLLIIICLLLKL